MHFHIEHHMYASVPCYNLPKHKRLLPHLPPTPRGLIATWRHIADILKRQKTDTTYQYTASLPFDPGYPSNTNFVTHYGINQSVVQNSGNNNPYRA